MELANILELIHAVSDSDLTEFNLQDDTLNISMSKEKTIVQQMAVNTDPADAQQYQPVVQQAVHVESVNAVNDEVQTGSVVKSPLVGTYYAASSPENPPFVKVGDKVSKGQILGIVEAMKLMNEIESEFDGTVKEILVENEQMVEFLNFALLIDAKYAIFPLFSGLLRIATAPVCASASTIRTPGITGSCGKCPAKCGSL